MLIFSVLAGWWLARRQLTSERASSLAFLLLVTLLLRQTDFISNRFSPFVDSSGLGFIAFGIVWDALTIGAWANTGNARGLPRVSRIFLYLGYVLLTVTVINWAVASHDLEETVGRRPAISALWDWMRSASPCCTRSSLSRWWGRFEASASPPSQSRPKTRPTSRPHAMLE